MPPAVQVQAESSPQARGAALPLSTFGPYVVAAAMVLPLLAPEVWSGYRLGLADSVLGTIASSEQPLSVRSPGGQWAIGLALLWFALAYWQRRIRWWEALLVVVGGTAALLRTGNAWLDALALIAPLGAQLHGARPRTVILAAAAAAGVLVGAASLWTTRPPALPQAAITAAQATHGTVFANWQWAAELQRDLGQDRRVLAAGGLASETPAFWLDYVRIIQDFERWPSELQDLNVDVLVLTTDQPVVGSVRSASEWHVVYDRDHVVVAERTAP